MEQISIITYILYCSYFEIKVARFDPENPRKNKK